MFARNVSMHLKLRRVMEFTKEMDREVIPLLRRQKGFRDEITFIASEGTGPVAISIWNDGEPSDQSYAVEIFRTLMLTATLRWNCGAERANDTSTQGFKGLEIRLRLC